MKNVYFYFKTNKLFGQPNMKVFWILQIGLLIQNDILFVMYLMTSSRKHRAEKASNKESKVGILIPNLLQTNSVYLDKKPPFLVLGFLICKTRGLD